LKKYHIDRHTIEVTRNVHRRPKQVGGTESLSTFIVRLHCAMPLNDSHCHFFSTRFFVALGRGLRNADPLAPDLRALELLGWDKPGSSEQLADRWVAELDAHGVSRAAIIASVPGDASAVATAVRRHPTRFVGFFMVDAAQHDAAAVTATALDKGQLKTICLFPAMHRYALYDDRVRGIFDVAAARPGTVVFVHCGVLSVGARKRLGLPSPFDIRFGNPLDLHGLALAYPSVSIIIPHFGAGLLREALMVADLCPNVFLDTSSSNSWIKYLPGLSLEAVFKQALAIAGPQRLLFGTDSSFFPRGWVRDVYAKQWALLDALGADDDAKARIFGGNFDRLFPL
jgi:predicted TIM-barrel fold metal-dependent hydrolase